jgi:hypothetical protein
MYAARSAASLRDKLSRWAWQQQKQSQLERKGQLAAFYGKVAEKIE